MPAHNPHAITSATLRLLQANAASVRKLVRPSPARLGTEFTTVRVWDGHNNKWKVHPVTSRKHVMEALPEVVPAAQPRPWPSPAPVPSAKAPARPKIAAP